MKSKLISSILSVPVAYLIWQVAAEYWNVHADRSTASINLLGSLLGIFAFICVGLNIYVFGAALKRKTEPYAKAAAISSGLSGIIAAMVIALYVAAIAGASLHQSA